MRTLSCFFEALLSPVLDRFEWLLSLGTVHQLSSAAVIESQHFFREKSRHFFCGKMSGAKNRTRAAGVQSLNATAVLWRPPAAIKIVSLLFRFKWPFWIMTRPLSWPLLFMAIYFIIKAEPFFTIWDITYKTFEHVDYYHKHLLVLACHELVLDGFDRQFQATVHFPLGSAVD